MFITHKYAVMMLGVLIELPMLDAVIDDLRVNAPAPQIGKNTPIVGVFGSVSYTHLTLPTKLEV